MNATITRSLDLRGVPEGTHLATAAVAMLDLAPGELLEVLTDDPQAPRDFSVWCRANGHQLIAQDQRDGLHHLVVRRQPVRPPADFDPHHAFRWNARAAGIISGFDRYAEGRGEMRWKLAGLLPILRADGPDVSRSGADRWREGEFFRSRITDLRLLAAPG